MASIVGLAFVLVILPTVRTQGECKEQAVGEGGPSPLPSAWAPYTAALCTLLTFLPGLF